MSNPQSSEGKEESVTFAEFLQSVPPTGFRRISDIQVATSPTYAAMMAAPTLTLYCASCGRDQNFHAKAPGVQLTKSPANFFLHYNCRNCLSTSKVFAIWAMADEPSSKLGHAYKYGEAPPFGPPTPSRLLALLEDEKETFLKGRKSEHQGLGIGAFAYYRRVVENQKNRFLDEIIKVAERTGANPATIAKLQAAKVETRFTNAMEMVKDAIPGNPLTLLHNALSKRLHQGTDEQCLERAKDIRLIMQEFTERSAVALKDDAELTAALGRLQNDDSASGKRS
jgi:hypothetical protein